MVCVWQLSLSAFYIFVTLSKILLPWIFLSPLTIILMANVNDKLLRWTNGYRGHAKYHQSAAEAHYNNLANQICLESIAQFITTRAILTRIFAFVCGYFWCVWLWISDRSWVKCHRSCDRPLNSLLIAACHDRKFWCRRRPRARTQRTHTIDVRQWAVTGVRYAPRAI